MSKSFSPYFERNKRPILDQLSKYFKSSRHVLEIGSGTGQHAVFFASRMPHLNWHTSDMSENHTSINAWIAESSLKNIHTSLEFMIGRDTWPDIDVDAVFTANTTHIMQPSEAKKMMELVSEKLPEGGIFCQYGPMKVDDEFTTQSNREFDEYLKQNGFGGILDIEQLNLWATDLKLTAKVAMPANNFLLVWRKNSAS
ncbi:DUF938 domain-containing protein [Escherichia coli]|jgi:cyclopropane fatty-acyl-phospholipid synthase-like methyltransferase|uniref:DUF938 domain-containing protein n=2 Tax=Gammaproteobacteria TaxID=1236 RepID=A0A2P1BQC7_9GAMM|nr:MULTISPECIES: DUF938 domain-containing protein [Gammaproteobacteria]EKO3677758.1 DUF938 domain-containing protein [Vibrio metschnikovii]EKU5386376.1 DUF938 domain-containing protein [Escherichia coli]ELA9961568.1 DUF938 domain-containing protein [Proteus mirabilis]HAD1945960.1 DUF938 domain-containing protein [Salmonella enterica subsp. enterica serovar Typhimurium]HBX6771913.1 DUF938 domain-containing protein [Klebsiella pneumoniae]HBZ5598810.1 DUF938 domain-containing protein [Morganella